MTDRELMQMALDALSMAVEPKKGKVYAFDFQPIDCAAMHLKAIEALRAALAQPEQVISQEWQQAGPDAKLRHYSLVLRDLDKTIEGWCEQPEFYLDGKRIDVTQQKPVAWRKKWEGDEDYTYYWMNRYKGSEPLYTAPPQREWVGLTDEEVKATWSELWYDLGNGKFAASDDSSRHTTVMFAKAIEAKLREKNT